MKRTKINKKADPPLSKKGEICTSATYPTHQRHLLRLKKFYSIGRPWCRAGFIGGVVLDDDLSWSIVDVVGGSKNDWWRLRRLAKSVWRCCDEGRTKPKLFADIVSRVLVLLHRPPPVESFNTSGASASLLLTPPSLVSPSDMSAR